MEFDIYKLSMLGYKNKTKLSIIKLLNGYKKVKDNLLYAFYRNYLRRSGAPFVLWNFRANADYSYILNRTFAKSLTSAIAVSRLLITR